MNKPAQIAEAKPAASILLLRERPQEAQLSMEVFMVVRHHQIDVASGALVFPGGKVDNRDSHEHLACRFPASVLNHEPTDTRQLVFKIAAIRETFEETGVLFARHMNEDQLVSAQDLLKLSGYRNALVKQEVSLADMLAEEKLTLATDLLLPYAHWITPKMAPKRFDTHFFVARAPDDQIALHDGSESVDSVWITPQALLKEADEGRWKIVFPTRMNIEKLALQATFEQVKTHLQQHPPVTIEPEFLDFEDGKYLCIPEEAGYPQWKIAIEKVLTP